MLNHRKQQTTARLLKKIMLQKRQIPKTAAQKILMTVPTKILIPMKILMTSPGIHMTVGTVLIQNQSM